MKKDEKNKDGFQDIFRTTVINDDLKKYQNDPIVLKKAAQATELLKKMKWPSTLKA